MNDEDFMTHTLPETLEEMLSVSRARTTFYNQVRLAEHNFNNLCTIDHAGGQFRITPELLGYLKHRVEIDVSRAVVLDMNNMPILVEDLQGLFDHAWSIYHEALNEYFDEVQRLRQSRKVGKMVEAE